MSATLPYVGPYSVYRPVAMSALFCLSARCHVSHCSVYGPVSVGQFLLQPHASASRLRVCVRVEPASGDDLVDIGISRDIDRDMYLWSPAVESIRESTTLTYGTNLAHP